MVCFCAHTRAKSYQRSKHKMLRSYERKIAQAFIDTNHSGYSKSDLLYARVYYFHQEREVADADNISKPIIDALKGHLYPDDKQVIFRSAACLDMQRDFEIDYTNVPADLVADISASILCGDSVIYIEVGSYSDVFIQFGGVNP